MGGSADNALPSLASNECTTVFISLSGSSCKDVYVYDRPGDFGCTYLHERVYVYINLNISIPTRTQQRDIN